MSVVWRSLLAGLLGGFLYQSCVRPAGAESWDISGSARRMAKALERIADEMERRR